MKELNNKLRFNLLYIIVYVSGIVLLAGLFNLQIVKGNDYRRISNTRLSRNMTVKASRGDILDSSGNKLVSTKMLYNLEFYKISLRLIEEKLNWINKNRKLICKTFIEEENMFYGLNEDIEKQLSKKEKAKIGNLEFSAPLTEEEFSNSLYITYTNFYVEDEKNISCNFDLDCEPDYLFGHLANIEIDENNDILMSGING